MPSPAEIAKKLSEQQTWMVATTWKGTRQWENCFDLCGFGSGVSSTARSLRRRGLVEGKWGTDDFGGGLIRLTELGIAVAKELETP